MNKEPMDVTDFVKHIGTWEPKGFNPRPPRIVELLRALGMCGRSGKPAINEEKCRLAHDYICALESRVMTLREEVERQKPKYPLGLDLPRFHANGKNIGFYSDLIEALAKAQNHLSSNTYDNRLKEFWKDVVQELLVKLRTREATETIKEAE